MSSKNFNSLTGELTELQRKRNTLLEGIQKIEVREDADDPGQQERLERLQTGVAKLTEQIADVEGRYRDQLKAGVASGKYATEDGVDLSSGFQPEPENLYPHLRADRDRAMRGIERCVNLPGFDNEAAKRVETMLRTTDRDGADARYVAAVANPHYERAFAKVIADPKQGHLGFTPQEAEAMRVVRQVEQQRAMGDATGAIGGYGVPITIDPSIVLTNVGALNPLRELSRVEMISTYTWRGISSDGVVAGFGAEAAEASDASPTLVQPTTTVAKGFAFIPYSFELAYDYPNLLSELVTLLTDAKLVVEATKFLLGSGTNEPAGVLNIGGTGGLVQANSRVLTATTATFAYADLWTLKQAIPVRFLADSVVVMNPITLDTTYQLSPSGSTTLALLMPQGRNGPLTGLPTAQLSTLATGVVTGTKTAVVGNFKKGFLITDRIGVQIEPIPFIFGASQRPTGQRGAYLWWRTGSTTIGAGSAAGCPLRYLEIK